MRAEFHDSRVFITGATGFIGANLAAELIMRGAQVHALVRPDANPWRLRAVRHQITLHDGDLRDHSRLHDLVTAIQPEYIFHMVRSLTSSTAEERSTTLHTNVIGLFNLLEACEHLDYLGFVCGASSLEYGFRPRPHRETDLLDPAIFYGATKAAGTILCRQYARAKKRPISILRFFSVFGPWESPKRLIPTAIAAALLGHDLPLTQGDFRRDFIFIEDVVQACLMASQTDLPPGEIINIGTGKQTSNRQIVALIEQLCGQKLRVFKGEFAPRETDTGHWVADNRKAKRLLGWHPQHTLETGLEKTIDWVKQHLDVYQNAGC